jgi:cell division protein FtsB
MDTGKFLQSSLKLVGIVLLIVAAFLFLQKLARPYMLTRVENTEIAKAKADTSQAETEQAKLKNDIAYLQTERGMETEARRLGWVKQGEIAIMVPQPRKPAPVTVTVETHRSLWESAKHKLSNLFHHQQ